MAKPVAAAGTPAQPAPVRRPHPMTRQVPRQVRRWALRALVLVGALVGLAAQAHTGAHPHEGASALDQPPMATRPEHTGHTA